MALIICPECKNEISDQSESCIYCGYPIKDNSEIKTNLVDLVGDDIVNEKSSITTSKVEAYDVMILDYSGLKITAKNNLVKICDIQKSDAANILSELPCYIYDDIEKSDAEQIATRLMNVGFRVAVYDPIGNVRYFEPPTYYSRPLPILVPVPRRRRVILRKPVIAPRPRAVRMPRKAPGMGMGLRTRRVGFSSGPSRPTPKMGGPRRPR